MKWSRRYNRVDVIKVDVLKRSRHSLTVASRPAIRYVLSDNKRLVSRLPNSGCSLASCQGFVVIKVIKVKSSQCL